MKKLFLILLLVSFSFALFAQETITIVRSGDRLHITCTMIAVETQYVYIPFRPYADTDVNADTSSVTPPANWLESGVWGMAVKCDSTAAPTDGTYDSTYFWIKPMMYDGVASYNDSTFLKMSASNTDIYTATTAQRFSPIPSNRTGITDAWYTTLLNGEIWPFAGVIIGIKLEDASGVLNWTIDIYRYR